METADLNAAVAVAEWLHTPRADGRPKVFKSGFFMPQMEDVMAHYKAAFVNAVNPVNYIICVEDHAVIVEPFMLTNNLTGELLEFRRVNDSVWLLVRCPIVREEADKWAKGIYIDIKHDQSRTWQIVGQHIWPLIANNLCGVCLHFHTLSRLRGQIAACTTLRWIHSMETADLNAAVAVAEWLHTPRADGRPKVFKSGFFMPQMEEALAHYKAALVNAVNPVNYIICVEDHAVIVEPFMLTNNLTGELLEFRRFNDSVWLLVRCPIVRKEADKWAKWEKEAIWLNWFCPWNRIYIYL
uniref:DUF4116 domain-containing protein n=1 Tax=Globodera pallida TaxID=36090 RepID=A0A183BSM3_GLOPA